MFPPVLLHVNGRWRQGEGGDSLPVANPATGETLGHVAQASTADLDEALDAAHQGFATWRATSAYDRAKLMRRAADLLRERSEDVARLMTLEQGKPLAESRLEIRAAADIIDWFAEEARRAYGRIVPARQPGVTQMVLKEPVGPVAAFTPWNFPINQVVRKLGAALAGAHMKRVTMELGGHAPVIVCGDADIEQAARQTAAAKFRNAGQVCVAPTRFLVQDAVHDQFVDRFVAATSAITVGDGLADGTTMGPLANERRVPALERLIDDATRKGAELRTGGARISNIGNFFQPTVLTGATADMAMMNEEPFGPLAMVRSFGDLEEAIVEANRLPYGLAAYAYTRSQRSAHAIGERVETGMVTINHLGLGLPELPFGGVKDSGFGSEGGSEAIEAYFTPKLVTLAS